ncbi:MAG: hypothetical protein HPY45_14830 [Anaerolineae bacterium]|nr:hypothetical protein [Anaerolineae bacterium]
MSKFLPLKLHQELKDAGLPVISVDETGSVTIEGDATPQQIATIEQIKAAHVPVPSLPELEISSITTETLIKMVLTLWDKVIEQKPDKDLTLKDQAAAKLTSAKQNAAQLHAFLTQEYQKEHDKQKP